MASLTLRPQGTSLFRWLSLALMATIIAGCVPRATRPNPQLPTEPVLRPEEPRVNPRLPADETRNRVAVLVPLTGRDAALGQSILNAANLALLDMGGERIRITAYDTAAAGRAAQAMTRAVEGARGRLVGIQTFDPSAAGVRGASTRLLAQGTPDAVLLADVPRAILAGVPVIRAASPAPRLLATERWASEGNIGANVALDRKSVG